MDSCNWASAHWSPASEVQQMRTVRLQQISYSSRFGATHLSIWRWRDNHFVVEYQQGGINSTNHLHSPDASESLDSLDELVLIELTHSDRMEHQGKCSPHGQSLFTTRLYDNKIEMAIFRWIWEDLGYDGMRTVVYQDPGENQD
jgi:hypothetical protein